MSFCRNCGADVGDAKFCHACGQATTATEASQPQYAQPPKTANGHSEYYPSLCEYSSNATKLFVFGLLSIICCMGIGLIFEIIAIVISSKIKKVYEHGDKLTNPEEIAMYNSAVSRHKTGSVLACIALSITGVLLFVLIMLLAIGSQI